MMEARTFKRSAIALAIAGAFAVGAMSADRISLHTAQAAPSNVSAAVAVAAPAATPNNAAPLAALPDFSVLVEKYGPAVVNISVTSDGTKAAARQGGMPDIPEELAPFFRGMPNPNMPSPGPMRGLGSGFIVDADGIILTNAHVVDGADEVTVKLTDKREFTAKVLGSDKTTDIAVLKIDAKNLPTVKIGNPETHTRRRMGRRDRHAVRPREHGDLRHRQRQVALAARRRRTCRSSRPMPRSTPATRAARCSTSRAR